MELPSVMEYYKTKTLDKGRVSTTLTLFMIDADVFENICLAYIRGEASVVECRRGTTIKAPKDKYDRKVAKQEAYKKLKKERLDIKVINSVDGITRVYLQDDFVITKNKNNKITIYQNDDRTY